MAPPFRIDARIVMRRAGSQAPNTWGAKASLISMTSMSASAEPARSRAFRWHEPGRHHDARLDAADGAGEDTGDRHQPAFSPAAILFPINSATTPSLIPEALPAVTTPPGAKA